MTKYITLIFIMVLLKPLYTTACKCMYYSSLSFFDIQRSDLAFIGVCEKLTRENGYNYAIFKVSHLIKGDVRYKTLVKTLSSSNRSGDCVQHFSIGEKWLILAKETIVGFRVDHCGNSQPLNGDGIALMKTIAHEYPFSDKTNSDFFYNKDEIRIKGKLVKGVEEGYWYYFYQDKLKYKILYHAGQVKELHRKNGNYYKLVVFERGKVKRVKDVGAKETSNIYVKYTPANMVMSYYRNKKFDANMIIDKQTRTVTVIDSKGKDITHKDD